MLFFAVNLRNFFYCIKLLSNRVVEEKHTLLIQTLHLVVIGGEQIGVSVKSQVIEAKYTFNFLLRLQFTMSLGLSSEF